MPYSHKRIIVVSTMLLGDCLLSSCIPRSFRQAYPNCTIDVLVSRNGHLAYENNPDIDNILYLKKSPSVKDLWAFVRENWRKYDVVINERATDRTAIYSWLLGKFRIGFISRKVKSFSFQRWVYDKSLVEPGDGRHRLQRNLDLVRLAGVEPIAKIVSPHCDKKLPIIFESPYVVVHTPASVDFKQWPVEHWQQLVLRLNQAGYKMLFTGSDNCRDRSIVEQVTSVLDINDESWCDLSGQLSLAQTGAMIKNSMGFIGLDTGPAHLAAGFSVPIVALFGPTPPVKWAPWPTTPSNIAATDPFKVRQPQQTAQNVCVIQFDIACVPCYAKQCRITHSDRKPECLHKISPDQVFAAIQQHIPLDV